MKKSSVLPLLGALLAVAATSPARSLPSGIPGPEADALQRDLEALKARLTLLRTDGAGVPARLADADLFRKSAEWALRYEERLAPADLALVRRAVDRGTERAKALAEDKTPWAAKKGRLVRGYTSAVDGSTQPYMLLVPESYDPRKPIRLDVVLHGSTRPTGLSELRFLSPFDEGDTGGAPITDQDFIELRPLGRIENGYRWAGETDVFEAIDDVCSAYNIDRDRIVLRGMSMGASGTWHLGLKNPDRFAALGPYCGYVDTFNFSRTPGMNFIPVGPLPPYQEKMLHLVDSIDYAANAGVVPSIAAMGEKDPFFQAHVLMEDAMRREGLKMVNLISPGTAHVQDPTTHREQMLRLGIYAGRGREAAPKHLRFVTWSLRYSRCYWLEVLGMESQYQRAEIEARLIPEQKIEVETPKNVTRFALRFPEVWKPVGMVTVGGQPVRLPEPEPGRPLGVLVIGRERGRWKYLGSKDTDERRKRPGLQGPIDDVFSRPFLCVRGTGTPWNPAVGAWAEANLKRFAYEWHRYFRGELPVKDDTAVTEADLRKYHIVLFGDPGSNRWIRKALPDLPIQWSKTELRLGAARYAAADHAPALVFPNPMGAGKGRYLVINSGHTFHEKELASLNYLLFPRLGDWAVMQVGPRLPSTPSDPVDETPVVTGFFDEEWKLPAGAIPAPVEK